MVELSELLQPAPEEIENRRAAVQEIREVVNTIWPSARVEVFGSFATGWSCNISVAMLAS
jgi:non-canonical poly(A) RNA polymerase PAPD5/7